VPLHPGELTDHVKTIRAEGFPDYNVHPAGKRKEYSAIIYLEPFDWRNQRAFGFDMGSNDIRRAAMERARDTGRGAASGMITLVQETEKDQQAGFLSYVSLYAKGQPVDTVEQRRSAFLGWVYAPFRAEDLMHGLLGSTDSNLQFFIHDGEEAVDSNLLFASDTRKFEQPDFTKNVPVEVQGRMWNVEFRAPKGTIAARISGLPTVVAIAAGAVDLLLFYVLFSVQFLQKKGADSCRKHDRGAAG
jgi:CHASE1-domain containing sensor protein